MAQVHRDLGPQREREKLKTRPVTYLNITFREQEILKNTGTSEMLRETKPKYTPAKQPDTRVLFTRNMGWPKPRTIQAWVGLTRNRAETAAT